MKTVVIVDIVIQRCVIAAANDVPKLGYYHVVL